MKMGWTDWVLVSEQQCTSLSSPPNAVKIDCLFFSLTWFQCSYDRCKGSFTRKVHSLWVVHVGCTFNYHVGGIMQHNSANNNNKILLFQNAAPIHFSKCVALIHLTKTKLWSGWCVESQECTRRYDRCINCEQKKASGQVNTSCLRISNFMFCCSPCIEAMSWKKISIRSVGCLCYRPCGCVDVWSCACINFREW